MEEESIIKISGVFTKKATIYKYRKYLEWAFGK